MLEHIPFEDAYAALKSMRKNAKFVVMSLPYKTITVRGSVKVPVFPELDVCIKLPVIRKKGWLMKGITGSWDVQFLSGISKKN